MRRFYAVPFGGPPSRHPRREPDDGELHHRAYIPRLVELTRAGVVDPSALVTQLGGVEDAISAYERFDQREEGWLKVVLDPARVAA